MSKLLEQPRSWEKVTDYYSKGQPGTFATFSRIARGAGSSNAVMKGFMTISRAAWPLTLAAGVGVAAYEISNAPAAEKPRVAAREVGGIVGGAAGAILGVGATALAIGFFVSNPVGWVAGLAVATSFVVAGFTSYYGSEAGRSIGEGIYDKIAGR